MIGFVTSYKFALVIQLSIPESKPRWPTAPHRHATMCSIIIKFQTDIVNRSVTTPKPSFRTNLFKPACAFLNLESFIDMSQM